jgi:microcystin-dependent protein
MDPFIGEIRIFAGNFAPTGWFLCQGQTLPLAQYQALFAVIGVAYGGNGSTNFMLPNLQGRMAISAGQGPGGTNFQLGTAAGQASVTLTQQQLPTHTHPATFAGAAPSGSSNITVNVQGSSAPGGTTAPTGNYLAGSSKGSASADLYVANPAASTLGNIAGVSASLSGLPTPAGTVTVGLAGNGLPVSTEPPYLVINYIIAYEGIFPTRP